MANRVQRAEEREVQVSAETYLLQTTILIESLCQALQGVGWTALGAAS